MAAVQLTVNTNSVREEINKAVTINIDMLVKQFSITLQQCNNAKNTYEKLEEMKRMGTFPLDINFKFNPVTPPKYFNDTEIYYTEQQAIITECKNMLFNTRMEFYRRNIIELDKKLITFKTKEKFTEQLVSSNPIFKEIPDFTNNDHWETYYFKIRTIECEFLKMNPKESHKPMMEEDSEMMRILKHMDVMMKKVDTLEKIIRAPVIEKHHNNRGRSPHRRSKSQTHRQSKSPKNGKKQYQSPKHHGQKHSKSPNHYPLQDHKAGDRGKDSTKNGSKQTAPRKTHTNQQSVSPYRRNPSPPAHGDREARREKGNNTHQRRR